MALTKNVIVEQIADTAWLSQESIRRDHRIPS